MEQFNLVRGSKCGGNMMSGRDQSGKWLGYCWNSEEYWFDCRHRKEIYAFSKASKRHSEAEQDAYSMHTVSAGPKGLPRRQGHLTLVPSILGAYTVCKGTLGFTFTVCKILCGDSDCINDMTVSIFRTSLWTCRQYFPPKRQHPHYMKQVIILPLIKSLLRLICFLWWSFALSRNGRGWKHRDQVLIFEHRFLMAYKSS